MKCKLILKCYRSYYSYPRKYIGRQLAASMDAKLVLILAFACICGTLKNRNDRLSPFGGNMAGVANIYGKSPEPALPYYLKDYGKIENKLLPSRDMRNKGTKFYTLCDMIIIIPSLYLY